MPTGPLGLRSVVECASRHATAARRGVPAPRCVGFTPGVLSCIIAVAVASAGAITRDPRCRREWALAVYHGELCCGVPAPCHNGRWCDPRRRRRGRAAAQVQQSLRRCRNGGAVYVLCVVALTVLLVLCHSLCRVNVVPTTTLVAPACAAANTPTVPAVVSAAVLCPLTDMAFIWHSLSLAQSRVAGRARSF